MSTNLKQTQAAKTSNDNAVADRKPGKDYTIAPVAAGAGSTSQATVGGTTYNELPHDVQAFITGIIRVLSYNWPWPDQFHDTVLGAISNFKNSNQLVLGELDELLANIEQ